jgi:hypothetical protein
MVQESGRFRRVTIPWGRDRKPRLILVPTRQPRQRHDAMMDRARARHRPPESATKHMSNTSLSFSSNNINQNMAYMFNNAHEGVAKTSLHNNYEHQT